MLIMLNFNNYSIKTKLILVFVFFKIIPLFLLAAIGIFSFMEINELLQKSSNEIIKKSSASVKNSTDVAIKDSIKALDKKSQELLEYKTLSIAQKVADFLYKRDDDIIFLSNQEISESSLKKFYSQKNGKIYLPEEFYFDESDENWLPTNNYVPKKNQELAKSKYNVLEFNKINPNFINTKTIPIYKEIAYYDISGQEIYKISSIDKSLKNISKKENTYIKAEDYYKKSLELKKGEIYVSKVVGEYVPSPIVGVFTKTKAKKANIQFEPHNYAYAGAENPLGKKFEGIIRFVTPVYKKKTLQGYLSFALDHHHIMNFTDFVDPLSTSPLVISDASKGNYAFMWSSDFKAISHPRDYFIVGYDSSTGEMVPGWIDSSMQKNFKKSKEKNLNNFLKKQTQFLNQSLKKKPNIEQAKIGQMALDCRYLNFAPQCQGWKQLTEEGGYGSFIILWSDVWKLTTAATIPYYTGQYKDSKRGFGFVTIGANVDEFHKAATKTKENIYKTLAKEEKIIEKNILQVTKSIFENIKKHINRMAIITIILLIIVIYVAIYMSNNISNRINKIMIGTQKIKNKDFGYQIEESEKDEIGKLKISFNEMAQSINTLTSDLEYKLFTDDLTKLKNRNSFLKEIVDYTNPILFLLDIDQFKNINNYYGIEAGNFVLTEFGKLLKEFSKKRDMNVYRIGSDEFLLLKDESQCNSTNEKLVKELYIVIKNKRFINKSLHIDTTVNFTCGISCGKDNLLEKADLALNEALRKKVSFLSYNESNIHMNMHKENIIWKEKINSAISNDMVVPFFQEIINIKNPNEKKYEALIRIIDNENIISPYFFLNIAKDAKLYPELTKIMIEKTFKIFDKKDAKFSINLSIDDITNATTVDFIHNKLQKYDVKDKLIFELLESEEIGNFEDIIPFIEDMKSLGVEFAIDDFGSGYSNFSYLLKIKPDYIKIDGSLIKNLTHTSNEYYIINSIVKFAKSLDIKVVAEHVSSEELVHVLNDFDINYMQGFYFSMPSPNLS